MNPARKPSEFKMAQDALCLSESMFGDPQWKAWWRQQPVKEVEVEDHMNGERFPRRLAPIEILDRHVWADVQTGTLYRADNGRCLSANLRTAKVPEWTGPWPTHGPLKVINRET